MRDSCQLTCDPRPGGGVILTVEIQTFEGLHVVQEMPYDFEGASLLLAAIMTKAGITEASIAGGSLTIREAGR
jgi:hypothetical protein